MPTVEFTLASYTSAADISPRSPVLPFSAEAGAGVLRSAEPSLAPGVPEGSALGSSVGASVGACVGSEVGDSAEASVAGSSGKAPSGSELAVGSDDSETAASSRAAGAAESRSFIHPPPAEPTSPPSSEKHRASAMIAAPDMRFFSFFLGAVEAAVLSAGEALGSYSSFISFTPYTYCIRIPRDPVSFSVSIVTPHAENKLKKT